MSEQLTLSNIRHRRHHRHHHFDPAVEGIQDAGRDLSKTFAKLEKRCKARRIVHAIRNCDARAVNSVLDHHCRVQCFFKRPGYDCVRICCSFNRGAATVTFDICVRSLNNGYGYNGYLF
ncbi:hypothetical protein [Paenibacillus sp. HB172176]|uniref:hypothetical protein n=1 Tax=Paenibacillus sp. HB172176 TaxID=2493690 RepID=UPI00143C7C9D|nr:hypothetical protein [Paenibacillus sp. HB172176]